MASLTVAELPENVAQVVRSCARFIGVSVKDLFVADHNHEELSEGAYSIAYEGAYEWPWLFTNAVYEGKYEAPGDLFLEAGTGWYLGVYPNTSC